MQGAYASWFDADSNGMQEAVIVAVDGPNVIVDSRKGELRIPISSAKPVRPVCCAVGGGGGGGGLCLCGESNVSGCSAATTEHLSVVGSWMEISSRASAMTKRLWYFATPQPMKSSLFQMLQESLLSSSLFSLKCQNVKEQTCFDLNDC